jgi:cell wall-associated NlpC family hydrolase
MTLRPGDVLLYRPKGVFGWIIRLKTWHPIAHVEIYLGNQQSAASRDGVGVGLYPLRLEGLAHVVRPKLPFDAAKALAFTEGMKGTPYGWLDLLNFGSISIDTKGIVCSPFVTLLLRDNGIPVFGDEPANLVAPFQFLTSELLSDVTQQVLV